MIPEHARMRAEILRALGHPARVLILDALAEGDRCVAELNERVPIDQSGLSRHLAVLRRAGIVRDRREGMRVFYHLETPCILKAFACALDVIESETARRTRSLRKRPTPTG